MGRWIRRALILALRVDSIAAEQAANKPARIAGPDEPELQAEALLTAAFNARLPSCLPAAFQMLEHLKTNERLESYSLALRSASAAELGTVLLDLGDDAGAIVQLNRWRELFALGEIEPSVCVLTCLVAAARPDLRAATYRDADVTGASTVPALVADEWRSQGTGDGWHEIVSGLKTLLETGARLPF